MFAALSDHAVFLRQFWQRYHTTGAVLPSGRWLARALCRYVGPHNARPLRVLEVGPGTGAVTGVLVRRLQPEDRLTMVELNDAFVRHLQQRLQHDPAFREVAPRCSLVQSRLEDLPADQRYDRIVSGLPLNNFAVADVEAILAAFERLLAPGGVLSFFEYVAIRRVKAVVSGRADRQRLQGIARALDGALAGREIRRDAVWPNVPPAWVHHVRLQPEDGSPGVRAEANGAAAPPVTDP